MSTDPRQERQKTHLVYLLLLVVPVFFATNNVAARMADGIVPPVALTFWRWALAVLLLSPVVVSIFYRKAEILREEFRSIVLLAFLGMFTVGVATYWGAKTTTAANIGLIYATTPALILIFDRFLTGNRLSIFQVLGLFACLSGMLYIVSKGDLGVFLGAEFTQGDLIVGAGTLGWAAYSVLLKFWPSRLTVVERSSVISLSGCLIAFPFMIYEYNFIESYVFDMQSMAIIALVGVVSGALLIVVHAYITAEIGPSRAVILLYLIPLYNVALSWLVLREEILVYHAVGGAIVLAGVYLTSLRVPSLSTPAARGK
ncbi:DMT family transporter [Telmatospirillum sp. J64-1]|uniref:DMT family transporter n=1 Tax=Telmatospirillum sp. J64-1 TaxID=2502183 RepID=UPI00115D9756|nr:DMT family transporter [Telmatospirillum sp. J64-1]